MKDLDITQPVQHNATGQRLYPVPGTERDDHMPLTTDQITARLRPLPSAVYEVDIPITSVERSLTDFEQSYGLDLAPDFQRGHVWTQTQQSAYMTALFRGALARGLMTIQWNSPEFTHNAEDPVVGLDPRRVVIVDGLQRLTAVRSFMAGNITIADGITCDDLRSVHYLGPNFRLRFAVLALRTRADLLRYYLDINAGGTPHSADEIARVRSLLDNGGERSPS